MERRVAGGGGTGCENDGFMGQTTSHQVTGAIPSPRRLSDLGNRYENVSV